MKIIRDGFFPLCILFSAAFALVLSAGCSAPTGMSDELSVRGGITSASMEGRWTIDKDASARYARQSPRWREEDEGSVHTVLDIMAAGYFITIGEAFISIEARGSKAEIPVELIEYSEDKSVYRGAVRDVEVIFTALLDRNGNLNLRSSVSDDFDYLLWKRID